MEHILFVESEGKAYRLVIMSDTLSDAIILVLSEYPALTRLLITETDGSLTELDLNE